MALGKKTTSKQEKPQKFKVKSWYANRYQFVLVQRNILLIFALFSIISVSFGLIFLNYVISSKSLEPYIIEIEEKTGIPVVVDQLNSETLTENELMKRYFLNQFIQAANRYSANTYKDDINKVRVLSNANTFSIIRSYINPRLLGTETEISINVKSIQFIDANTAKIRIKTTIIEKNNKSIESHQLIDLTYVVTPSLNLSQKDRLLNPLGFQVTSYLITEEIAE